MLIKIDLKDESSSASSESAGLQTGGQEEDGLLHLFDWHRQRGAGPAVKLVGNYRIEDSKTKLIKSRNGDTLGPVELIVWPEQGNQGDWREQDG